MQQHQICPEAQITPNSFQKALAQKKIQIYLTLKGQSCHLPSAYEEFVLLSHFDC